MRKTAEFGRGSFTYVGNVSEVKEKLDGLFKKLEHPVLNDIQLDRTGWTGLEHYPSLIADLYEGEPIVLAVKAASLPGPSHAPRTNRHSAMVAAPLDETSHGSWWALRLLGKAKDLRPDGRGLHRHC